MTAEEVAAHLRLAPHREGGRYRQTWVAETAGDERASGTAILFLLAHGERSHWHRVDAVEVWLFHAGAPLVLSTSATKAGPAADALLGADLLAGEMPQLVVPSGWWQAARSTGDWTLVSCTVSPGFRFEGFELAPSGFDVPR